MIAISIDAMGGDYGADVTVPASILALNRHSNLKLILVGDQDLLRKKIAELEFKDNDRLIVRHASEQVAMDEAPAKALRTKKDSSMRVAINLVKEGAVKATVSAGNTGALMATAHFVLKTIPGVDRPAIIASLPTFDENKEVRVLDLGANVDSDANHLYQFAVMGSVLTKAVDNIALPKIGLLNIGAESIKGNEQVKDTDQLLAQDKNLNYIGYVEGDDIFKGVADVIVCDGFIGNVALKSTEGAVKLIVHYIKKSFARNIFTKIIALIALPVLKALKKDLDPGRHNGASLIGLKGIVIKSHGGAKTLAFAQAIEEAILEVEKNVPQLIGNEVSRLLEKKF